MAAARGLEVLRIAEVDQGVETGHGFEHDVPAAPAVTAVGAAIFDIFLTPEGDGPGAASAGLHIDLGLVEEMHGRPLCNSCRKCEENGKSPFVSSAVETPKHRGLSTLLKENGLSLEPRFDPDDG